MEEKQVKWCKDQKIEHHLRQLKIQFEAEQVAFQEIDLVASAERQCRIGKKINEDWVLEYALAMESGAVFPYCILNREKKGRFTVWSGLHRLHAAGTLGVTLVDAYVVGVHDPRMADILPRVVNTWEGRRLSKEETLLHGKYLVEHHSLETEQVAEMLSIKPDTLSVYMRGADVAAKISQQGVNPSGISKSMLLKLSPLRGNANILREASRLVTSKNLSHDECVQAIDDAKAASTELQQMAAIAKWEKVGMERSRQPASIPTEIRQVVRPKFMSRLTQLAKFVSKYNTLEQVQIVEDADLRVVKSDWNTIQRQMGKILNGKGE